MQDDARQEEIMLANIKHEEMMLNDVSQVFD